MKEGMTINYNAPIINHGTLNGDIINPTYHIGSMKAEDIEANVKAEITKEIPDDACAVDEAEKTQIQEKTRTFFTDEEIKELINQLLDAKNTKGEYLLTRVYSWYAIYRVLKEKRNYPDNMEGFSKKMTELGFTKSLDLTKDKKEVRLYCSIASIKKANVNFPKIYEKADKPVVRVDEWQQFKNINNKYAELCAVAAFLLEKLA